MSVWQISVNSTGLTALTEELWKMSVEAEYPVAHFAFLWDVTCLSPRISTAAGRGLLPSCFCVKSGAWAQPAGLQLRCRRKKLCAETCFSVLTLQGSSLQQRNNNIWSQSSRFSRGFLSHPFTGQVGCWRQAQLQPCRIAVRVLACSLLFF